MQCSKSLPLMPFCLLRLLCWLKRVLLFSSACEDLVCQHASISHADFVMLS